MLGGICIEMDKHIIADIDGRLGNQMFQNSIIRALSDKWYKDYKIELYIRMIENRSGGDRWLG